MKTICVPKNNLAQKHLDANECQPDELIELTIDEEVFNDLFNLGFFYSINNLAHSNIDNFEDDSITNKKFLLKILNSDLFNEKKYSKNLFDAISNIKDMFNKALTFKTGVYFYF